MELDEIMINIKSILEEMHLSNNDQWDKDYPQSKDFTEDIADGNLYVYEDEYNIICGLICIDFNEPAEYQGPNWSSDEKSMVVHRMTVSVNCRGRGIGTGLMK